MAQILAGARDFLGCEVCTLLMLRIQVVRVAIRGCTIIHLQHFEGSQSVEESLRILRWQVPSEQQESTTSLRNITTQKT